MTRKSLLDSILDFLSQKHLPRLLIPAVVLALIVILLLGATIEVWMALAGLGAVLVALDSQRGAGRRAVYVALAALIGMVLRPGGITIAPIGSTVLGCVMPLLAFSLSYAQRRGSAASNKPPSRIMTRITNGGGGNTTSGNEEELYTRIHVTTDGMVKASQAIKEVAAQQSTGALEQVDVIHTTNTKVEDFLELAQQVMEETSDMTRTAQDAADIARSGQQALDRVLTGMSQISAQVATIGQKIVQLAQLARRIDEIITSVSEIATQSNLLALNASIEAARAGTHGRGFAVVADEVRSLSHQSTTAAQQIRAILGEIQAAVKQTVDATEGGVNLVEDGVVSTRSAHQVMSRLAANVIQSYDTIKNISGAIRQQADTMEQISISMSRIEQITQQNLVSTRVVDRISANLTQLSDDLQQTVSGSVTMETA